MITFERALEQALHERLDDAEVVLDRWVGSDPFLVEAARDLLDAIRWRVREHAAAGRWESAELCADLAERAVQDWLPQFLRPPGD
jgi:hypothetical protein